MDLVKTHLTSAVNQEIVLLKSQIKQLTEKCARLEQENQTLKKHALPETLALIENRSTVSIQLDNNLFFNF
jgi:cell division protein FtsB